MNLRSTAPWQQANVESVQCRIGSGASSINSIVASHVGLRSKHIPLALWLTMVHSMMAKGGALLLALSCFSRCWAIRSPSTKGVTASSASCSPLRNHGTHFTVPVAVGTPPQTFNILADTGSNAIIIGSCACRQRRTCFPKSK